MLPSSLKFFRSPGSVMMPLVRLFAIERSSEMAAIHQSLKSWRLVTAKFISREKKYICGYSCQLNLNQFVVEAIFGGLDPLTTYLDFMTYWLYDCRFKRVNFSGRVVF